MVQICQGVGANLTLAWLHVTAFRHSGYDMYGQGHSFLCLPLTMEFFVS